MKQTHWILTLLLAAGVTFCSTAQAGEAVDLEAEAQQAAKEEAEQKAEREKGATGKYQRTFYGLYQALPESGNGESIAPDVVGTFLTNETDRKPGRTYLVKAENGNKGILEALRKMHGKKAEVTGKLRNYNPEGEGKYLIVSLVVEVAPTIKRGERRKFGGL
jgi:hypothetical protein